MAKFLRMKEMYFHTIILEKEKTIQEENKNRNANEKKVEIEFENETAENNHEKKAQMESIEKKINDSDIELKWKYAAYVMDRFFFFFSLFYFVIIFVSIILPNIFNM